RAQPVGYRGGARDRLLEARHQLLEGLLDRAHQQLFLVLEVEVDGPLGDARAVRDALHRGLAQPEVRDHLARGAQDLTGAELLDQLFLGARRRSLGHPRPRAPRGATRSPGRRLIYPAECRVSRLNGLAPARNSQPPAEERRCRLPISRARFPPRRLQRGPNPPLAGPGRRAPPPPRAGPDPGGGRAATAAPAPEGAT